MRQSVATTTIPESHAWHDRAVRARARVDLPARRTRRTRQENALAYPCWAPSAQVAVEARRRAVLAGRSPDRPRSARHRERGLPLALASPQRPLDMPP